MKIIKAIFPVILSITLFSSCSSSKWIQSELQNIYFDLDYDLETPVYSGEIDKTVYLNFIDNSNMDYFTSVKKKSIAVVPLILFNYWHEKYEIALGEKSLTQTYREFLTDALLAECNRSTCFDLVKSDEKNSTDSNYVLDVKIIQNNTQSSITYANLFIFIPLGSDIWDFGSSDYTVQPAVSDLKIAVELTQGGNCLFEKKYTIQETGNVKNSYSANEECIYTMTECLSLGTKKMVENISKDLNLILLAQ